MNQNVMPRRFRPDAGIAIGPILFIIAILGILAGAIAAGSGSFTASTNSEGSRAKASAVIEIGQALKFGFERLINNGVDLSNIDTDPLSTSSTSALFSPVGGGISAPSVTMANDPTKDVWLYPFIAIPNIGTSSGSKLAMLRVNLSLCDEINAKAIALAPGTATTESADLGDFTDPLLNAAASSAWPTSFHGKPTGCVKNTNSASSGHYFYQVLSVQ